MVLDFQVRRFLAFPHLMFNLTRFLFPIYKMSVRNFLGIQWQKVLLCMEYGTEILYTKTGAISPSSENPVPTGSTAPELLISLFRYKCLYF